MRRCLVLLLLAAAAACGRPQAGQGPALVTVDSTTRLQVMTGWESSASSQIHRPSWPFIKDSLYTLVIDDLGLTRLRFEVNSGIENRVDYAQRWLDQQISYRQWRCVTYSTTNDNDDPNVIDWAGFQFAGIDRIAEQIVLPLTRLAAQRGRPIKLTLTYVAFAPKRCGREYHHDRVEEYAEFILAVMLHLREKYALVPEMIEVVLEPDNADEPIWSGRLMGEAMVATAARLRAAGFTPAFIAPSTVDMGRASHWADSIAAVPGALPLWRELSYHRYRGVDLDSLRAIAERGRRYGVRTAMLEHIGSSYEELHEDLTVGNVSAWTQYSLSAPTLRDRGGVYYAIGGGSPSGAVLIESSRTRYLKQYFRNVDLGAQRIGATSDQAQADPVAFINPDGRFVVIVKTTEARSLAVHGLPAGRYAFHYTTPDSVGTLRPDTVIAAGGVLLASMPARGVLAILGNHHR